MNIPKVAIEQILTEIKEIIRSKAGIVIATDRYIDLEIVLRSRLEKTGRSPQEYLTFFRNNPNEIIHVASQFTIQETSFFRYKAHFDRLKHEIFPGYFRHGKKSIRILSAGCATGEEPYTIAMLLDEFLQVYPGVECTILATDINENTLDFAQQGVFSEYKLRNTEEYYLLKYFYIRENRKKKVYYLKNRIKEMVTFHHYNLISEPFELKEQKPVDIIFCENVIIYFCRESIQRLIHNFYELLNWDGYLFLGYSETLNLLDHNFILSWWYDSYAYQKKPQDEVEQYRQTMYQPERKGNITEQEFLPTEINVYDLSYEELLQLLLKNFYTNESHQYFTLFRKINQARLEVDERFHVIKAECLMADRDLMNAADECRLSISHKPDYLDAHLLLAAIYLEQGMLENALFEINTALYIDEDSPSAYYLKAMCYESKQEEKNVQITLARAREKLNLAGGRLQTDIFPANPAMREVMLKRICDA